MDRNEFNQFLNDNNKNLVIVKAYADWCAPCKRISPLVDFEVNGLISEHGADNVRFIQINMDEDSDVASYIKIQKLPTIISYISGQPIHVNVGANEQDIRDFFKKSSCSYAMTNSSDASF